MNQIRKIALLVAALAMVLVAVASSPNQAAASGSYHFDFEQTLYPFQPVFNGAGKATGLSLQMVTGENGCPIMTGNAYANLKMTTLAGTNGDMPLPTATWMLGYVPASGTNQ